MVKEVIWSIKPQNQLAQIIKYIALDSVLNAEKVKIEILASARKLAANETMYPLDKYKKDNDGSFRAYELHRHSNIVQGNRKKHNYHKNSAYKHVAKKILKIMFCFYLRL